MPNKIIFNTISQLPEAKSLNDSALMEISEIVKTISDPNGDPVNIYQSKRIMAKNVKGSLYESVFDELKNKHGLQDGIKFDIINENLNKIIKGDNFLELKGKHTFEKAPLIKQEYKTKEEFDKLNDETVNFKSLRNFETTGNSLLINENSLYATQYMNVEDGLYPDDVKIGIEHAPSSEAERHNVYIFMINGRKSNIWTVPADGMFTCYGWVDEENPDEEANAQRWVALEANFKQKDGLDNWKILQLQPVIPNAFCSYVSFSFPVNKGLELRLESGFTVGTNSNKYNSIQGSMTNHLANAFVGGIYSKYNIIT